MSRLVFVPCLLGILLLATALIAPSARADDAATPAAQAAKPLTKKRRKAKPVAKTRAKGKKIREKENEGTEALDRFKADTVIQSQYNDSSGHPLEVDPD